MRRRRVALSLSAVTLLLLLSLLFLPKLLSTKPGRVFIAHEIGDRLGGELHIGEASLRWGRGQKLTSVTWIDSTGEVQIHLDEVTSTASLWSFLWGSSSVGDLEINGWLLLLEPIKESHPPIPSEEGPKSEPVPFPLTGSLRFSDGEVATITAGGRETLLSSVTGGIQVSGNRSHLAASLSAKSGEGSLSGDYAASRPGPSALQIDGEKVPSQLVDLLIGRKHPRLQGKWNELVGPSFNIKVESNAAAGSLALISDSFLLKAAGTIADGSFTLSGPATLAASLSPELIAPNPFPPPLYAPPSLAAPTALSIVVEKLSFPVGPWREAIAGAIGKGRLNTSSILLNDNLLGSWSTPALVIEGSRIDRSMPLKIDGGFAFVNIFSQGKVGFGLTFDSPKSGALSLDVDRFPSLWLASLFPSIRTTASFLGSLINLHLNAHGSLAEGAGLLSFSSDAFTLNKVAFTLKNGLSPDETVQLTYRIPPIVLAYYFTPLFRDIIIDQVTPIDVRIERLFIPIPFAKNQFQGDIHLLCSAIRGGKIPGQSEFLIGQTTASLEKGLVKVATAFHPLKPESAIARLIGPVTEIELESPLPWEGGRGPFTFAASSNRIDVKGAGELIDGEILRIEQPTEIKLVLQPTVSGPTLSQPTPVYCTLSPFEINFEEPVWSDLTFSADLSMEEAEVVDKSATPIAALTDLTSSIAWDGPSNHLEAKVASDTSGYASGEAGRLSAEFSINGLIAGGKLRWNAAAGRIDIEASQFPLAIADGILQDELTTLFLGSTLDLTAKGNFTQLGHLHGQLSADLAAPLCKGAIDLNFARTISLKQPAELDWSLVPGAMERLLIYLHGGGLPHFATSTPTNLKLRLQDLALPWSGGNSFPTDIGADLSLDIGSVKYGPLENPTVFSLDRLAATFSAKQLSRRFRYSVEFELTGETKGRALLRGEAQDLFRSDGAINRATFSADGGVELDHLPMRPLLTLLPIPQKVDQQLIALLGSELSLASVWNLEQLNGPLSLHLNASHSRIDLDGTFSSGRFFLTSPLRAQLEVTPYLGSAVLGKINPFFASAIHSDGPIQLDVPAQGVQLPLYPWSPIELQVPQATLQLGKIALANRGAIAKLLSIFPKVGNEAIVYAWFTPQTASIASGFATLNRMDALIASQLHIATWGTFNIANQRADLNLGISGESLHTLLGLDVGDDDYLIVPMYGQMGDLAIDWFRATAQIASLTAQSMGGRAAQFGKLIDLVSGSTKRRVQMPPEPPLPWK